MDAFTSQHLAVSFSVHPRRIYCSRMFVIVRRTPGLCPKFSAQLTALATAINAKCINQYVRRRQFPVPVALGRTVVPVVDSRLTRDATGA